MLSSARGDIEAYCKARNLAVRIDATNLEPCCTRNKLRLLLLPELERSYNPAVKDSLCRSGELVGTEHDFVRQQAEKMYRGLVKGPDGGTIQVDIAGFCGVHLALQREIVRLAIEKLQGNIKGVGFYHIEKAIQFIMNGRVGATIELPGKLCLTRKVQTAQLARRLASADVPRQTFLPVALNVPGRTVIPEIGKAVETSISADYRPPRDKNEIICDWAKLRPPLYVRSRRDGDRFCPAGINGSKKVKDFFIDAKIDRGRREAIPLLCDQRDIIWLVGLRQAAKGKVSSETNSYVIMRFCQADREGD